MGIIILVVVIYLVLRDLGANRTTTSWRSGRAAGSAAPPNTFEEDIQHTLEVRGLKLTPQWRVSGYRIDLVVHHPDRDDEFVLAIECDGATYHSSGEARERDRRRQKELESQGWRFHRIWSTDWFRDRDLEIERAMRAYREALRAANRTAS